MKYYTVSELCQIMDISRQVVIRHINDGTLVASNVGRGEVKPEYRVTEQALQDFMERRRVVKEPVKRTRNVKKLPKVDYEEFV